MVRPRRHTRKSTANLLRPTATLADLQQVRSPFALSVGRFLRIRENPPLTVYSYHLRFLGCLSSCSQPGPVSTPHAVLRTPSCPASQSAKPLPQPTSMLGTSSGHGFESAPSTATLLGHPCCRFHRTHQQCVTRLLSCSPEKYLFWAVAPTLASSL